MRVVLQYCEDRRRETSLWWWICADTAGRIIVKQQGGLTQTNIWTHADVNSTGEETFHHIQEVIVIFIIDEDTSIWWQFERSAADHLIDVSTGDVGTCPTPTLNTPLTDRSCQLYTLTVINSVLLSSTQLGGDWGVLGANVTCSRDEELQSSGNSTTCRVSLFKMGCCLSVLLWCFWYLIRACGLDTWHNRWN